MDRKVDQPYLFHIRDAITLIEEWATGKTFDDFSNDKKLQMRMPETHSFMDILPWTKRRCGTWCSQIFPYSKRRFYHF